MTMRHFMTLVETATAPLNEIEMGGGIDSSTLDNMRAKNQHADHPEFVGQHELFPGVFPDLAKLHGTLAAPYKMIGRIEKFVVAIKTDEKDDEMFVVFDEGTAIAWASFRDKPVTPHHGNMYHDLHGDGAQVSGVNVHDDYMGKRLALKLYHFLLTHVFDYIIADYAQTRAGVKLWKILNNSNAFDVRVYDPSKGYSRKRWSGKDLDQVYRNDDLILWATLRGKAHKVDTGSDD